MLIAKERARKRERAGTAGRKALQSIAKRGSVPGKGPEPSCALSLLQSMATTEYSYITPPNSAAISKSHFYHRQQNKCYPQRCLLAYFEAIHFILP